MTISDDPASPPGPPLDLSNRALPIVSPIPGRERAFRIHPEEHDPKFFGPMPGEPPRHRFDAPNGEYRVLYLGQTFAACFAERFLRAASGTFLPEEKLNRAAVSQAMFERPLKLVQLYGDGLFRVGATAASINGGYPLARRWALALFDHPDKPDGLLYRSRWDDELTCAALFDRSENAVSFSNTTSLLEREELWAVMARYEIALG